LPPDRQPPDTAERPAAVTRSAQTALSTYEDGDPVDVGLTCKGVTLPVRDQDFDRGWGSSQHSVVRDIKRRGQGGRIYDHLAGADVGREVTREGHVRDPSPALRRTGSGGPPSAKGQDGAA